MRFVDEYRAPEQVMQLIEHLCERTTLIPIICSACPPVVDLAASSVA